MNRKTFVMSHRATCKNWGWSWSFINENEKLIIFGAWTHHVEGNRCLILDEDWERDESGRRKNAYVESLENIQRVERGEYRLMTFPMVLSEAGSDDGVAKIDHIIPELMLKSLIHDGTGWYATDYIAGHPIPNVLASENEPPYKAKLPAIRDWLIEVARHKGKVTYGQVMKAFGIDRFSLRHAMDSLGHQAKNLNEPIITALIVNKKTQRCSPGLFNEFGVHDDEAERQLLYDFWMSNKRLTQAEAVTTDIEIKAARFVSVEARPEQAAFRRQVYLACKGKCVISGCDVLKALDAAHKHGRDWRLGHNRAEDGYLLRKDLHALYDHNLLWITVKGEVELAPSVVEHYKQFAGSKI